MEVVAAPGRGRRGAEADSELCRRHHRLHTLSRAEASMEAVAAPGRAAEAACELQRVGAAVAAAQGRMDLRVCIRPLFFGFVLRAMAEEVG